MTSAKAYQKPRVTRRPRGAPQYQIVLTIEAAGTDSQQLSDALDAWLASQGYWLNMGEVQAI